MDENWADQGRREARYLMEWPAPHLPAWAGLSDMRKKLEEEFTAPSCEFHFSSWRTLVGVGVQDVEGQASDEGEILWRVVLPCPRVVLIEHHIERPMQIVLDAPMLPDERRRFFGVRRCDSTA